MRFMDIFRRKKEFKNQEGDEWDTIFYQGMGCSQVNALKYTGSQKITASTGEVMWCTGRNNLLPIDVIYRLHIGTEIADVNLNPFKSKKSYFHPMKLLNSAYTYYVNKSNGFCFQPSTSTNPESVVFHTIKPSQFSLGQETDIESHRLKYATWLQLQNRSKNLVLYGVSRGTLATFCAFAKEKYPEVKLVILEGALDSVASVLPKTLGNIFRVNSGSKHLDKVIKKSVSFFEKYQIIKYRFDGPSPISCLENFPEKVPVVFITSVADKVVPSSHTETIANALANRKKNDVYLLKLKRAGHSNYMFDNLEDRNDYEMFLHAIYKKYNLKHNSVLASSGQHLVQQSLLFEIKPTPTRRRRFLFG